MNNQKSQMNRIREIFSSGEEYTVAQAIKISGMTPVQVRKAVFRLIGSKEIQATKVSGSVSRYRRRAPDSIVTIRRVPNVGNVEHARATAPNSIFDIGRL